MSYKLHRELAQVEELLMKDNLLINTVFISHQLSAKNQLETYKLDEQGSLIICPVVYVADDNIDTKISMLGFIEEQNGSEEPFTIELEDYIDI